MNCPRCGHELATRRIESQTVDECPIGHGMWLSAEEFREAVDDAAPDLAWLDFDIWKHAEKFVATAVPVKCPNCGAEMVTLDYAGIEIDYCRRCEGIWLDSHTLSDVIAALNEEANARSVPEYVAASLAEARDLFDGPEGPRAEWRDLRQVLRLLQYRILSEHPGWLKSLTDIERSVPS